MARGKNLQLRGRYYVGRWDTGFQNPEKHPQSNELFNNALASRAQSTCRNGALVLSTRPAPEQNEVQWGYQALGSLRVGVRKRLHGGHRAEQAPGSGTA